MNTYTKSKALSLLLGATVAVGGVAASQADAATPSRARIVVAVPASTSSLSVPYPYRHIRQGVSKRHRHGKCFHPFRGYRIKCSANGLRQLHPYGRD